jgi:hypothetical protein
MPASMTTYAGLALLAMLVMGCCGLTATDEPTNGECTNQMQEVLSQYMI